MKHKKKKRDKNSLKNSFIDSWKYLKSSRKFIYAIIVIFVASALVGFIFPIPEVILQKILELIQEILAKTEGLSFLGLFSFIFINNLEVSLIGMVAGILLGVFPIITSIGNGYLLGFVAKINAHEEGILSLWKILPHGIFELPAIFISLGLGLRLGLIIFKKKQGTFRDNFLSSLKTFFFIVVPLLIVAALIESALIAFFA